MFKDLLFLATLLCIAAPFSMAEEATHKLKEDLNRGIKELRALGKGSQKPADLTCPECSNTKPSPENENHKVNCIDISDNFCKKLWDKDHQGRLTLFDGHLDVGNHPNSDVAQAKVADLQALADSEARLPEDLQVVLKPLLSNLRSLINREPYDEKWKRELAVLEYRISTECEDVIEARTLKKYPELKDKPYRKLSTDEKTKFKTEQEDLSAQILEAKYKNSPNWKKATALFESVKNDLLTQINTFPMDAQKRLLFSNKIKSVRMDLPYNDLRRLGTSYACGSTEVNAYYSPAQNAFVLCAGLFNGFQSESSLFTVIAHELSHSIDSGTFASDRLSEESELNRELQKLVRKNAPFDCKDWNSFIEKYISPETLIEIKDRNPLRSLVDCLVPKEKDKLKDWNSDRVRDFAEEAARSEMSGYATDNNFTLLIQKNYQEDGETKPNQYFLNPERLYRRDKGDSTGDFKDRDPTPYEIFTQTLKCSPATTANYEQFAQGKVPLTPKQFQSVLEETNLIQQRLYEEQLRYEGTDSASLVSRGFAVNNQEDFADWLANRAFARHLEKIEGIEARREASAAAWGLFCNRPGPVEEARQLTEVEKAFSIEPHPDDRVRKRSSYTKTVANLIDCEPEKEGTRMGTCEPKK